MGKTYAESFLANHAVAPADLFILERLEAKADEFRRAGYKNVFTSPGPWTSGIDLLILAVKPQDAPALYPHLKLLLSEKQTVLSIMAGVSVKTIQEALGIQKVVRAMPNLPAQIGMGITGFTSDSSVTKSGLFAVQNLLNTTGKSIYFENEEMLHAVTAVSGSGPAYVFCFMEAMMEAARQMGFSATEAEVLVMQTFMGAVHLLGQNKISCTEWISRVASKGGTTEAALNSFNSNNLSDAIRQGLTAALNRSVELGKQA